MKFFCFVLVLSFTKVIYSQVECLNEDIAKCQIDSSFQVYDYFNQRTDSLFCVYGRVYLMNCAPYYIQKKKTLYITRKTTYEDNSGLLDIFIDGELLFRYSMVNGKVEGTGIIFNLHTGKVAYQATFKNGKLDGPLFCLSYDDSEVIHSMLFKKGKPKKILYTQDVGQTKKNYRKINKRKYFRNGQCTGVVEYPFLQSKRKITVY